MDKIKKTYEKDLSIATTPSQKKFVEDTANIEIAKVNEQYSKQISSLETISQKIINNKAKQDELNSSIDKMNSKLKESKYNTDEIEKSSSNVGSKINDVIRKVGKWSLAIFGVRSAYMGIRKAMSMLTQYDDKMASNIEYISYALANTLKPVIETIINLVAKLLAYINYLSKAWFGKEIFASAKAFTDMKKSSAGIAKNAKQTENSLTDFDKITKLEDNSSSDSSSGGGVVAPSIDLSNMEGIEIPQWLKDFEKFCEPIINFFKDLIDKYGPVKGAIIGIVMALGGFIILKKIIGWITGLGKTGTSLTGFFDGLGKAASAIALLGGVALVIQSITDLIDTFSKSGMTLGDVAGLLGIVLGELAAAFLILLGALTMLQPSWQSIAAAAVIFVGLSLVIESLNSLFETLAASGMSVGDVGVILIEVMGSLVVLITALTVAAQFLQNPLAMGGLAVLGATIVGILATIALTLPTILDACAKFINNIAPFVIQLLTTIGLLIDMLINSLGKNLPPIVKSVGDLFTKIFNGISKVIQSVGNVIVNILNTAKNLVTTVLSSILNFINQLGPAINRFVDGCISAVTKLINFLISGIEYLVNRLVIDGVNGIINGINKIGKYVGFTIPTVAQFKIPRFVPKYMAGGGIVDVPKTGVNITRNVVAGEAGPEGVLPLSNETTMSRLGQEIGKWVTVPINLVNEIDGRVLSKKLLTFREKDAFARNGG